MQNTTEVTASAIRDQLALIKEFVGATGKISIDEKRNAVKSAVVVQVKGAENKYITTINP
jgi:branched-chain amino acid transport system substrate-binding protein